MIFRGFQALVGGRGEVGNLAPRSRLRDGMRPVRSTAKRNESGRVRFPLLLLLLLLVN